MMQVQSRCFANLNLLLFCCSRWRRRRRCLSVMLHETIRTRWFLAQHSVATLLRRCFELLQHCSNITTLCCIVLHPCNITLYSLVTGERRGRLLEGWDGRLFENIRYTTLYLLWQTFQFYPEFAKEQVNRDGNFTMTEVMQAFKFKMILDE